MKYKFNFLLAAVLFFSFVSSSFSESNSENSISETQNDSRLVNPLYQLSARNLVLADSPQLEYNIYYFDLIIAHTNLPESGPFEYAAGQFLLSYNWLIRLFGPLTYEIVPNTTDFTNPDALPVNPRVEGNKLILDRNANLVPGQGPIISPYLTGTRIVRMKITTKVPSFFNIPLKLKWLSNPADSTDTEVYAFIDGSPTNISDEGTLVIDSSNVSALNLKAVISGLYNVSNNTLNTRDTLKVFQCAIVPPYNILDSAVTVIDSISFRGICNFSNIPTGKYYTVVKSRNGLETWSRSGGDSLIIGNQVSYDFTDDSTKAYGNNLDLRGNIFCIYSGDVNQNGIIDIADLSLIDNAILNSSIGYSVEDVNGDNVVDISDAQITDNNVYKAISVKRP